MYMSDLGSNIGLSSRRRRIAALIAVIGMLFVGTRLGGIWPRDVDVGYSLDPGVVELDVDYLHAGEVVASARFRRDDPDNASIQHRVRLQPGTYQARITVYHADGHGLQHRRALQVPSDGLTRFDLKETTIPSE